MSTTDSAHTHTHGGRHGRFGDGRIRLGYPHSFEIPTLVSSHIRFQRYPRSFSIISLLIFPLISSRLNHNHHHQYHMGRTDGQTERSLAFDFCISFPIHFPGGLFRRKATRLYSFTEQGEREGGEGGKGSEGKSI
jgi:hypothetical protein